MELLTVSFFGHRKIEITERLKVNLYNLIEYLISIKHISVFVFGSKSQFNELCYQTVTELKEKYSKIRRVYVRAEYPYIREDYKSYLLNSYEDTYYPKSVLGAGRAVYIKRNYEMIDKSNICVFYYKEKHKCGTKIAYDYAIKKGKEIINIAEEA